VDLNQVYTAPAIPKLGRRNIKSALITGAIKPQIALNKTKFSFVKSFINPKIGQGLSAENLGPILKKEGDTDNKFSIIESFLGATNKILVQVQKQLAFDHLSRIAAEKLQLEKDKKRISRKKVSDKEKKLEEPGKGSILPKIFDRITAPIKSIFQKLIDFFSIILTGLIVNNAFNWLSKKENREKLKKFFDFVVDHWKEILIVLGTAKLLGVILKIVGVARLLKKFIDLFKKKPPGGPPNCGCNTNNPKGGGPSDPCAPVLNCIKDINGPTAEALAERIADTSKFRSLFDLLPFLIALRSNTKTPAAPVPKTAPVPAPGTTPASYGPLIERGRQKALLEDRSQSIPTPDGGRINIDRRGRVTRIQTGAEVAEGEKKSKNLLNLFGLTNLPAILGGIRGGRTTLGTNRLTNIPSTGTYPGLRTPGAVGEETLGGNNILRFSRATTLSGRSKGGTILKFSIGGTVGKGDRPGTDTVPAMVRGGERVMLDEGEEVINAKSSRLWRPTLKDINDNGARMWSQFVEGIKKQESTNTVQAENNTRFAKVLEDYDKVLKEEERRLRKKYNDAMLKNKPTRPGGGGGGGAPAAPTPVTSGGGSSGGGGGGAPPAAPTPVTSGGAAAPTPTSGGGDPYKGSDDPKLTMPEANKMGSPGIPGGKNSRGQKVPSVGDWVGDPPPKPKPTTSSASPESTASPIGLLPFKTKKPSTDNLSSLFSANRKNLESLKSSGPSIKVFNMAETNSAIDLTNKNKVGSVPVSGGDPTPLPNISPINGLFAEAMGGWMTSLGIGNRDRLII